MLWSREGGLVGRRRREAAARPAVRGRPVVQPDLRRLVLSRPRRPTTCWASTRPGWRTGTPWSAAGSSSTRSPGAKARPGPVGGEDIFQIAEVVNGSPHIYALGPHAASLFLRGEPARPGGRAAPGPRRGAGRVPGLGPGPRPARDRHAVHPGAGRLGRREPRRGSRTSSSRPITTSPCWSPPRSAPSRSPTAKRLLVSAIARVEPTGFRWVDRWKRDGRRPGPAPVPPGARRGARSPGGARGRCGPSSSTTPASGSARPRSRQLPGGEGVALVIDGRTAGFHWELVVE